MRDSWPIPNTKNLLHILGDVHAGTVATRLAQFQADMTRGNLPVPAIRLSVGDLTDAGTGTQDTTALALIAAISGSTPPPFYAACGNHDVWNDVRTATQWAAAYGFPGRNYTKDLGFATLVVIGPETFTTQLAQADLDFLGAALAASTKDCIVMCHYPLYNTVLGGAGQYQSIDSGFYVLGPNDSDDTEVRAVLNAHSTAKVWLCGHTHSRLDDPGFITTVNLGSRSIISVNASALQNTGRTPTWNDPLVTLWMNYYPDDHLEIRFRGHGGSKWCGTYTGSRVVSVAIPA